ncbi:MAG TPA: Uma2 family endonuclease [Isosphaeraceae bacterium]|nr:Uma2 family endonuclease [Isosphaeraceae bacterium]
MSSTIAPPSHEARLVVPDVSWPVYETWVDALPESTPVRMAYDGRDLEIMTKGPDHEDYRQVLGHLVVEIARSLKLPLKGLGETTWKRAEIQRGIEADQCYYFSPEKLRAAAKSRGDNDVTAFPNPDLAIEIDLSPSLIDRPGIYAAMGVAEVWRFDGKTLTIERLGPDGQYEEVEASAFLGVRPDDLVRWLVAEDASDEIAWLERLSAWLRKEWKKPS